MIGLVLVYAAVILLSSSTNCWSIWVLLPTETAKAYKELGDAKSIQKEFQNALSFYTRGIDVKCKDDQLNVELYLARSHLQESLGESVICCRR